MILLPELFSFTGEIEEVQSKTVRISMTESTFLSMSEHTHKFYLLEWDHYPCSYLKQFTLLLHKFNFHHRTYSYLMVMITCFCVVLFCFYHLFCHWNVS